MAPTPEQLMIDVQPNLIQAPQVTEQVVPTPVVKEAEVSMPSPREWIGQIDYGMNWYALGKEAFDTALKIYPEVLKYDIKKKVAQVNDLQFDYETEMRNSYSESISQPIAPGTSPLVENVDTPFNKAQDFQVRYKAAVNNLYNIKKADGNTQDIFEPEYDLEGLGTYWIDAVEAARAGLRNLSATSEKVQRDLMESFKDSYNQRETLNKFFQGLFVPDTKENRETINNWTNSITRGRSEVPFEQTTLNELVRQNPTTADGQPVFVFQKTKDNQLTAVIRPGVTEQDLLSAVGENNFRLITDIEAARENSARGINLAPNIYEETKQVLQSSNPTPSQVIKFRSRLATMPPEKLSQLFKNAGKDLTTEQQVKLMKAWTLSGMNIAQRPEMTTTTFIQELNSVKSSDAQMAMGVFNAINNIPIDGRVDRTEVINRLEASRQALISMLQGSGISEEIINKNLGTYDNFLRFAQENQQIMPYVVSSSLLYDTALRNGISTEQAIESVKTMYSMLAITDKNGTIIIPRHRLTGSINDAASSIDNSIMGVENYQIKPEFREFWDRNNNFQKMFKLTYLGNSVQPEQVPDIVDVTDGFIIPPSKTTPNEYHLSPEERFNIIYSYNATTTEDGVHRAEGVTAGEALRISIATHPSVVKAVLGKPPMSKQEAIYGASIAYNLIPQAEYWQWDMRYSSKDDAFINSSMGGMPFGISSIPLLTPIVTTDSLGNKTEINDLLAHRNIVTAPNSSFISLEDINGRPLTYLPFDIFETDTGLASQTKIEANNRLKELSKGRQSRSYQLLTKDTAVGFENYGIFSAAKRLDSKYDNSDNILIARIAEKENPEYISLLTREISVDQAYDAIFDPKFLKGVARLGESTSYGEISEENSYNIIMKLMDDPTITEAVKEKINRTSVNGKTTRIQVVTSILQALNGYRYNEQNLAIDPEFFKDAQQFWNNSLATNPFRIKPTEPFELDEYIPTKVSFDLSGTFGKPTTIEEIKRYKERFGQLPPNVLPQQKAEILKLIEESLQQEKQQLKQQQEQQYKLTTLPYDNNPSTKTKLRFNKNFDTVLSKDQEKQFQTWAFNNINTDIYNYSEDKGQYDYDYRGAWLVGITPDKTGHWPDTFKKPSHPTFSTDSIYASVKPEMAGKWNEKPENNQYPEGAIIDENTGQYYLKPKQVSPGAVSDKPYMKLIEEFEGLKTEADLWSSDNNIISTPSADTGNTTINIDGITFEYKMSNTLLKAYEKIYGKELAKELIQKAKQAQELDNLVGFERNLSKQNAILPSYSEEKINREIPMYEVKDGSKLNVNAAYVQNKKTNEEGIIFSQNAIENQSTHLHELVHAAQVNIHGLSRNSIKKSITKGLNTNLLDLLNNNKEAYNMFVYMMSPVEFPAHVAQYKAIYYQETGRTLTDTIGQEGKENLNNFKTWLKGYADRVKDTTIKPELLYQVLESPDSPIYSLFTSLIRQVAFVNTSDKNTRLA